MVPPGTDAETRIGRDWTRSIALVAIGIALILLSLYGISLDPDGYYEHRLRTVSLVLLPLCAVLLPFAVHRMILPLGPVLRLTPSGFTDPRAGHGEIPWTEITNAVRRGQFVQLTLRRGFSRSFRRTISQRLLNRSRKTAGPNHVLIADWCLATCTPELLDLIDAYRRAHLPTRD